MNIETEHTRSSPPSQVAATDASIDILRKRSLIVLIVLSCCLVPGSVLAVIALWAEPDVRGFEVWAVEYWWVVLACGGALFLIGSVALKFYLCCPVCNYRLSRLGISAHIIIAQSSGLKYCPHCGVSYRRDE